MSKELTGMTPHEAAAYWFVRQDAGTLTPDEQCRLQAWLDAAEANRRAYQQTLGTWTEIDSAADTGELRALRVAALAAAPAQRVWPRAAAIAALFLGAVALGAFTWRSFNGSARSSPAAAANDRAQYATASDQRSAVTLSDGTHVSMNLNTVLDADLTGAERRVRLDRGQAFFDVARDERRPFIVMAGDREIRALGTKFDVRLESGRVEVVLVEGKVRVDRNDASILQQLAKRAAAVELTPGQRLVAAKGSSPAVTPTNAAQVTSWREGWVVFEDETLEGAIAELNRYSKTPIVVPDEAVKNMRLSGVFRIGEPERFASTIQELLPIAVERGQGGETVLVPKSPSRP